MTTLTCDNFGVNNRARGHTTNRGRGNLSTGKKIAFTGAVVLALLMRAGDIDRSLHIDEVTTHDAYVTGSWRDAFNYSEPNNHVLHTIACKASVAVFGDSNPALRLPAIAAGLLSIAATYWLGALIASRVVGLVSALAMTLMPYVALYDSMARGYSMVTLFSLLFAIACLKYTRNPSWKWLVAAIAFIAAGAFTIPTFIMPAAGITLWSVVLLRVAGWDFDRMARRWLLPLGAGAAAAIALLYTPVVIVSDGGYKAITSNKWVASLPVVECIRDLPVHLWHSLRCVADGGLIAFAGVGFCVAASIGAVRRRDFATACLLPSLIAGTVGVIAANCVLPPERAFLFIAPFFVVVAASLYSTLHANNFGARGV